MTRKVIFSIYVIIAIIDAAIFYGISALAGLSIGWRAGIAAGAFCVSLMTLGLVCGAKVEETDA